MLEAYAPLNRPEGLLRLPDEVRGLIYHREKP